MSLRELLKKRDRTKNSDAPLPAPDFKFVRSDTFTQEVIQPPAHDDGSMLSPRSGRFPRFRRPSQSSAHSPSSREPSPSREKGERRLSDRLHIGRRSRSPSASSVNLPSTLPSVDDSTGDAQEREAQWEKRATVLAQSQINLGPSSPLHPPQQRSRSPSVVRVSDAEGDINIQEAIKLHEAGELEKSTQMFGQLADPNGANNALSQVLYGLALRHGWGCNPDPERAIMYLSAAAANSAQIEEQALKAGIKKGGAAKGELVLAIFELANCFRHGWGVAKDPVAARQYYETAANLGDTDAMNEVAWCYLEGFGGKKDKYMAAKYYRLAEENGNKTLGNSWIWKEKYNPK
ncbi:hypothetical protein VTO42DRAFT_4826 [Malbranchea cinnamomea]